MKEIHSKMPSKFIASAASFMYCFLWYTQLMAMRANVGIHPKEVLLNCALSIMFLLPVIGVVAGIVAVIDIVLHKSDGKRFSLYTRMVCAGLIGVIVGEALMVVDEAIFRYQANSAQRAGVNYYTRSRGWPNQSSSLIWRQEKGIYATD